MEAAFGTCLDPVDHVAPDIAAEYIPPLVQILERDTSPKCIERIELSHDRVKLSNADVDEILKTAIDYPVSGSLVELKNPSYRHSVDVLAHLPDNTRPIIESLTRAWANAAIAEDEIDARVQMQRRAAGLLEESLLDLDPQQLSLEEALTLSETHYAHYYNLLKPEGIVGLIEAF